MVKKSDDQQLQKPPVEDLSQQLADLQLALKQSQERERRALADYQNLLRQNQIERSNLLQLANSDLLLSILQPIEHLFQAAAQLNDQALDMIVKQLWQNLEANGLEEIVVLGKSFDLETMDVVEKTGAAKKVVKVLRRGYRLNGQIIQHAQVVLG